MLKFIIDLKRSVYLRDYTLKFVLKAKHLFLKLETELSYSLKNTV
jgi:hypothetical protein